MKRSLDPSVKPDKFEKGKPLFYEDKIHSLVIKSVQSGNHFTTRVRFMTNELEQVNEQLTDYTKMVHTSMNTLVAEEKKLVETVKNTSGKLRDASQKLADGLARVEKAANFDRLERYAATLERIEKSLTSLAELEQSGKLGKVAKALN